MKALKNRFIITAVSALLLAPAAFAADGTWTNTVGGSWASAANWQSSTIADGSGFTADFNTLDITADRTVTLDGARTNGNLIFGDTATGTGGSWILTNGTAGPLTLAGVNPTITVNALGSGKEARITASLAGVGGFTKAGVGTLTIAGGAGNTNSGSINVNEGRLNVTASSLYGSSSFKYVTNTITVASGAFLNYDQLFGPNNLVNNLRLSGSGISGSGALNLAYNATASGTITLDADATIAHDWNGGTISGSITGTDRNLTLKTTVNGQNGLAVSGPIQLGTGGITVAGAANSGFSVKLSGTNTYSGGTTNNSGILNVANARALGSGALTIPSNSTLQAGASISLTNAVQINPGVTGTLDANGFTLTLSGPLTGSGDLTKVGTGTIMLTGGTNNTLSGAINVNAGTLYVTASSLYGSSSFKYVTNTITVASGAFLNYDQLFGPDKLVNNLRLSGSGIGGSGAFNLGRDATAAGTITLDGDTTISHDYNGGTITGPIIGTNRNLTLKTTVNNQNGLAVSGPIQLGTGGITVTGAANSGGFSVRLSGTNTYSGATTVTAGTLALSGSGSISNSPIIILASNACFNVSGLSLPFTLGASQTLSNSAPGALLNGTNNTGSGTVSLVYDGVNPSFTITNGGMTLSASTTLRVNKTGAQLGHGIHKLIARTGSGTVTGTLPTSYSVSGGGAAAPNYLWLSGGELYLAVNNAPLAINATNSVPQGEIVNIPLNNGKYLLATDADGDPLTITSVSASLGNVGTDGSSINYTNTTAGTSDLIFYTVSDGFGGTDTKTITVIITSATGANLISATAGGGNAYLSYAGIPGYNYALDKATSIDPPIIWVPQVTNTANGQGRLSYTNLLSTWPTNNFFRTRHVP